MRKSGQAGARYGAHDEDVDPVFLQEAADEIGRIAALKMNVAVLAETSPVNQIVEHLASPLASPGDDPEQFVLRDPIPRISVQSLLKLEVPAGDDM